ncbi:rhodanese-like domain-containing protein [Cognatiluteimonas profundi]|uniref:rhodanese-like domain-containing protein n=1 Tax=Cognatiluteimonas profundi TaxID=2594501 RepID=UPI00131AD61B|nr:rhodanese-like domain-containing protein [Lysobacter profundi]
MNPSHSWLSDSIDVPPRDALSAIKAGATAIDVREPAEFAAAAIPGAINVPLGRIQQQGADALRLAGIDVDSAMSVVMVCRSGARSGIACQHLLDSLDGRARNLAGGVIAWQSAGFPLTPGGRGQI